ncbi:hypothetical protein FB388_1235 [Pseudonocardia cypriaca]|uniref:Uncharacterized protein n=1 Tax=Pseudonocardia cypriaca TaxID=882449 RepID=A0A543GCS3_9PSEU|nr:hypothetical protein FB388_1235 [Pseudonocardia cypriaca]
MINSLGDVGTVLKAGSLEEALDCVCGLYLNDPTGWSLPPTNQRRGPLGHP